MHDIIIIGGGVAGFGAAITLGSSEGTKIGTLSTLVIDDGKSDLKKAKLYNVPFLEKGTNGINALEKLKKDALEFKSVSFVSDTVISIEGECGNFTLTCKEQKFTSKYVILATGCHNLDITLNGKIIPTKSHELIPRDGMIKVQHSKRQELEDGIYVAGLLAGITTMYATALGSGVEAACAILSKIANKVAIIHDFEGSRK